MNYKKLLNDPAWVAKNWTPYLNRKAKEEPQPCGCGQASNTVCIGRVWTCITCHARDHVADMQSKTCGVSDNYNYFYEPLWGLKAEMDEGQWAMAELEADRLRAIAL